MDNTLQSTESRASPTPPTGAPAHLDREVREAPHARQQTAALHEHFAVAAEDRAAPAPEGPGYPAGPASAGGAAIRTVHTTQYTLVLSTDHLKHAKAPLKT